VEEAEEVESRERTWLVELRVKIGVRAKVIRRLESGEEQGRLDTRTRLL
jgi:hypothetical protein